MWIVVETSSFSVHNSIPHQSYPLITSLQPSLNSSSSLLLNAEEKPGQSTPQATTPMNKTVTNLKHSSNTSSKEINNNTNAPKKHQQTVSFISDHKNGKSKLHSTVTLADSEESIVSDSSFVKSYGDAQHVRMMVTLLLIYLIISFWLSCVNCTDWVWLIFSKRFSRLWLIV